MPPSRPRCGPEKDGTPIYDEGDRVVERWLPGVHSDVGGGYAETALSNLALDWMMTEASKAEAGGAGLGFSKGMRAQVQPDSRGVLHDSLTGVFKALRTRPRNVPALEKMGPFHSSALDREKSPPITQAPYRPTRKLAVGKHAVVSVYARQHWNATGLYLELGARYELSATGEWIDSTVKSGPGGTHDGHFQVGEIVQLAGTILGKVEAAFRSLSGNADADFVGTRRVTNPRRRRADFAQT